MKKRSAFACLFLVLHVNLCMAMAPEKRAELQKKIKTSIQEVKAAPSGSAQQKNAIENTQKLINQLAAPGGTYAEQAAVYMDELYQVAEPVATEEAPKTEQELMREEQKEDVPEEATEEQVAPEKKEEEVVPEIPKKEVPTKVEQEPAHEEEVPAPKKPKKRVRFALPDVELEEVQKQEAEQEERQKFGEYFDAYEKAVSDVQSSSKDFLAGITEGAEKSNSAEKRILLLSYLKTNIELNFNNAWDAWEADKNNKKNWLHFKALASIPADELEAYVKSLQMQEKDRKPIIKAINDFKLMAAKKQLEYATNAVEQATQNIKTVLETTKLKNPENKGGAGVQVPFKKGLEIQVLGLTENYDTVGRNMVVVIVKATKTLDKVLELQANLEDRAFINLNESKLKSSFFSLKKDGPLDKLNQSFEILKKLLEKEFLVPMEMHHKAARGAERDAEWSLTGMFIESVMLTLAEMWRKYEIKPAKTTQMWEDYLAEWRGKLDIL